MVFGHRFRGGPELGVRLEAHGDFPVSGADFAALETSRMGARAILKIVFGHRFRGGPELGVRLEAHGDFPVSGADFAAPAAAS